jgi:hypothetical protein
VIQPQGGESRPEVYRRGLLMVIDEGHASSY